MDRNVSRQGQMISSSVSKRSPVAPTNREVSQHDELIKYVYDAWHKITSEGSHGGPPPVFYKGGEQRIAGFIPFDLESWWGQRLVQNIHISRGHQ